MDPVALASVLSSGVVAVAGLFLAYRTGREQRRQELRLEEVRLRKEFHIERFRFRLTTYSAVWRTLGAVSSVNIGEGDDKYDALLAEPATLRRTASELYDQVYGEAGLLMTMETRNWIHVARRETLLFLDGSATLEAGDRLVNAFYYARRSLRSDLGIQDGKEPESIENLAARLGDGPAQS